MTEICPNLCSYIKCMENEGITAFTCTELNKKLSVTTTYDRRFYLVIKDKNCPLKNRR